MAVKSLIWSIYRDDSLFLSNELQFSENNPGSKSIAFVNDALLKAHNVNVFSYYLINKRKLVCLFGSALVPADEIKISQVVAQTLQLSSSQSEQSTISIDFSQPIPTREYNSSSPYNYLPSIPLCHRIFFSNIQNSNSNLFDANIISELLQDVFYVQIGDIITLDISKVNDLTKFTADKKKLQKLIKFKLTSSQTSQQQQQSQTSLQESSGSSQLFENSRKMLILRVEQILIISQTSNRELIPFYNDKDACNQPAFIVDFKSKDTDFKFESSRYNLPPVFRVIQENRTMQYKNFLEQEILPSKIYQPFLESVHKILKYSFTSHSSLLLIAPKGSGKKLLLRSLSEKYSMNYIEKDVKKIGSLGQLERLVIKGVNMRPCLIHVRNLKSLVHVIQHKTTEEPEKLVVRYVQDIISKFESLEKGICQDPASPCPCLLVFSMDKFDEASSTDNNLKNVFNEYFTLPKPSNVDLYERITKFRTSQANQLDGFYNPNNTKTLESLFRVAIGLPVFTFQKVLLKILSSGQLSSAQPSSEKMLNQIIESLENLRKSGDIESLSIPNVKWEDIGGLQDAKNDIIDTIMLPQLYPQVFDEFVRPRTGLLFFGPPGTGKTLLAKCIATETKMNFLSVKGPELLNMYIGESEKNVRDIFSKGRRNQPCVIFFDELDALAPNRGNGSDSSQVMDRIVAQFLTELDDINKDGVSLFVVGATNRPDLLDQGLLRPGRFDKLIYLGINTDEDTRLKILQAQTRKLQLESSVDFPSLLQQIPKNFTGADFYGLTSQTVLKAARRKILEIEAAFKQKKSELGENYSFNTFSEEIQVSNKSLTHVTIGAQDFEEALKKITPSVSEQELQKYEELRLKFQ